MKSNALQEKFKSEFPNIEIKFHILVESQNEEPGERSEIHTNFLIVGQNDVFVFV